MSSNEPQESAFPPGIGEINPGPLNPDMSPGHNNAVYVYVKDLRDNQPLSIVALRLFKFFSNGQQKYKYGLEVQINHDSVPQPDPAIEQFSIAAKNITNNFYWQGGVKLGQALCKTGITAKNGGNGVLVFFDTNNPDLPPQ